MGDAPLPRDLPVCHPPRAGLIVLLGPTASGKTGLAIALAERYGFPLLSADSRQVYRSMDVGTSKASAEERRRVPHGLIDLRDPDQPMTVREFQTAAEAAIADCHARRLTPLLVGGSGLYLAAITRGLTPPDVPPQPLLREQLDRLGQGWAHGLLSRADPASAARISPSDRPRTQRALEVLYATGRPSSSQQRRCPPSYPVLELGLNPADLHERINRRTAAMFRGGLLQETAVLMGRYGADLPMLDTPGYAEARQVLRRQLGLEQAIAITARRTRQLARRQLSWFRSQHSPRWLSSDDPDAARAELTGWAEASAVDGLRL